MRKGVFLFISCFIILTSLSAKEKQPEWVTDYRSVYPDLEYLAQRGRGNSAEKAKTDAASALARYFQMNVSANLSTILTSISSDDAVSETTTVIDEVSVQSDVKLITLEYTDPWYNKKEKKWYCIAYINRKNAWIQYQPQIELCKKTFEELLKNVDTEEDFFLRMKLYKTAWIQGQEVLKKLEYGRIISPSEEKQYQSLRDEISKIPSQHSKCKNACIVFVKIENDYNRVLAAAISSALTKCGIKVAKTENEVSYIAEVNVEDNCVEGEPLSITPDLNLKIISHRKSSVITVYSFETSSSEKAIAYSLENARKKVYPKFAKEIEASVYKDITESFTL